MSDEHDNNRVVHEFIKSRYDDDGRPTETRKMQVIHAFFPQPPCDICKKTGFTIFAEKLG